MDPKMVPRSTKHRLQTRIGIKILFSLRKHKKGSLQCSKNPPKSTLGPTLSPQGCPKSSQDLSETTPRHHFHHFLTKFGTIFHIIYTQFLHRFRETSNNRNQQYEQKKHISSMIPEPTIVDFGLAGFRLRITIYVFFN